MSDTYGGGGGKYYREYNPYDGTPGKTIYVGGGNGGSGGLVAGGNGGAGGYTSDKRVAELTKTIESLVAEKKRKDQQADQYRRLITTLQTKIDVFADVIEHLYDMMQAEETHKEMLAQEKFAQDWVQKHVIDKHGGLLRATGYLPK